VDVVAPYYFHSTAGALEGRPGLRSDTGTVQLLLPPTAANQGLTEVDYRLQFSATEVIATGTVAIDPATDSFSVPVAGTLTRSELFLSVTARGPSPQGEPEPPPGAGGDVGELFTASGFFSVYAAGPPSDAPVPLASRTFTGSEKTRFTSTQPPMATGPGDTILMTVPADLTSISDLRARIASTPTGTSVEAGVSRTGDPRVAVVTVPLDYFSTGTAGGALLSLGGYAGSELIEHVVAVTMGNDPPASSVAIVPDGVNSPSGIVSLSASPVTAETYSIVVAPRSGPAVSSELRTVAAGATLEVPFSSAGFPNRLTVFRIVEQGGDQQSTTIVGEYSPPGQALAKTVIDELRPERSNLYLDNRNQFGQNRFTGETLSRQFDVTVDDARTEYSLKGGATLRVPLTSATNGSRISVEVDGVTILDQVIPPAGFPVPADRVDGSDRYEVAAAVSKRSYPAGADTAVIVSGQNFSDALSAAPLATRLEAPLLLTSAATLPSSIRQELTRLAPTNIVVVGGPNSVSDEIVAQLRAEFSVERISGSDRYAVSRSVADKWADTAPATVYIATGLSFPDALSAGAAAGAKNSPVVLVRGTVDSLDAATADALRSLQPESISIAGGPASVSSGTEDALAGIAPTTRFGGADRYEASAAINASAFSGSRDALLVTGLNYPDALSGGAWAGASNTPLYLSKTECVPKSVISQMKAQGVIDVTLIGGAASLGAGVRDLVSC
jgi:putative cell wall-binding protein